MAYGKMIELYLVSGSPDGIVEAVLSNWNGLAIKIPRDEVSSCDRQDFLQPGVYFLFCKDNEDEDSVYIGEAENVRERLMQHIRDSQAGKEPYLWNTAVAFFGRDLNKAMTRYLEDRLVALAKKCNQYLVLTKNTYRTKLKDSQISVMEEFIDNLKILISALGYKVLEPRVPKRNHNSETEAQNLLVLSSGGANATGIVTPTGFVVLKGSAINETTSESTLSQTTIKHREELMSSEKVKDLVTTEDLPFSSSTAAAQFVLGYHASGPGNWKAMDGQLLKDIESKEAP